MSEEKNDNQNLDYTKHDVQAVIIVYVFILLFDFRDLQDSKKF